MRGCSRTRTDWVLKGEEGWNDDTTAAYVARFDVGGEIFGLEGRLQGELVMVLLFVGFPVFLCCDKRRETSSTVPAERR